MSPIDLIVGTYGQEVKDLQKQLRLQGYDVAASEVERGFFGPTTRAALLRWQTEHRLQATGILDATTSASFRLGRESVVSRSPNSIACTDARDNSVTGLRDDGRVPETSGGRNGTSGVLNDPRQKQE